jgi:hypothetical protein
MLCPELAMKKDKTLYVAGSSNLQDGHKCITVRDYLEKEWQFKVLA